MKFRRKLLLVLVATVFLCVATVAWVVSALARRSFEKADEQRTTALVAQFRQEFDRRGEDVARRVENIAKSEAAARMAADVSHGPPDYAAYLDEAKTIAEAQQLDFLEFIDHDGIIISSAQWPAKFGYKKNLLLSTMQNAPFLNQEQLPDGTALSLSAVRKVPSDNSELYVIGGRKIDSDFVASLDPPAGMRAFFIRISRRCFLRNS